MKLGSAISRFARNQIYGWNATTLVWEDTGARGGLQVYDRFITERSFGQKKRVLTIPRDFTIPEKYSLVKVGNADEVFLIEHRNADIRFNDPYCYTYSLRDAKYHCTVRVESQAVNAAGVKLKTGITDLFQTWIDIDRFTSAGSTRFEETEFTIVTMTFPRGSVLSTDYYVDLDDGSRYNIDEIYDALDAVQAKGKRIGL